MKRQITIQFKLYAVCAIGVLLFSVAYPFCVEDLDCKILIEAFVLFCAFIIGAWREKKRTSVKKRNQYEETYKNIFEGAFLEDRKSYKSLVDASIYYNFSKYEKGIRILDRLEKKCRNTRDYAAVNTFKALCYEDAENWNQAIVCYEKVLHYDMANSMVWSNVGRLYAERGQKKEAYTAYSNAIFYNPKNAYAHCNMANILIEDCEPKEALKYALRAIELNSNLLQSMGAAAIAYKMLGDLENARKYRNMYGFNGGNVKGLDEKFIRIEEGEIWND